MNFYGRDFLKLLDYTPEEIEYLIKLAIAFKEKKKNFLFQAMMVTIQLEWWP